MRFRLRTDPLRAGWPFRWLFRPVFTMLLVGILISSAGMLPVLASSGPDHIYLPQVDGGGSPAGNVKIDHVQITQGVQDASNQVPLVAGRATRLRVFAQAVNAQGAQVGLPRLDVSVSASRDGIPLDGSPRQVASSLSSSISPDQYVDSINLDLPASWLSGSYDLVITVNADHAVQEDDYSDDTLVQHVAFYAVQPIKIVIVPVAYTHQPTGAVYPAPTRDVISDVIRRVYPVSQIQIDWHAPYAFEGNMADGAGFTQLLAEMDTLKANDQAPSSLFYYALVPTRNAQGTWFYGGIVGLGYIGSREAVGLDAPDPGMTAAHELGHNLGRYHAPCGFPASPDSQYPYPNAVIGAYGLDLESSVVYAPGVAKDLMSYCAPRWISDYTYRGLFNALVAPAPAALNGSGADTTGAGQAGLFIRAQVGPKGAKIFPVYRLDGAPDAAAAGSAYALQLVGAQGQVLSDTPARADEFATEDGSSLWGIRAFVPEGAQPAFSVRLLRNGEVLAERALSAASSGQAIIDPTHPAASQGQAVSVEKTGKAWVLRWANGVQPAILRYSTDGGATWTVIGVDKTGGSLTVDASSFDSPDALFQALPAQ